MILTAFFIDLGFNVYYKYLDYALRRKIKVMQSYFQWTNKTTEGMRTAKKKFAVCHKSLGLWHFRLPKCLNGQDLFGHNEWHMSSNASSILPPLLFSDTQNKIKTKLLSISIVIGIEMYHELLFNILYLISIAFSYISQCTLYYSSIYLHYDGH